tara:strand:+ start:22437 stop:24341 length:1905 start_codon:yes stop_codon:yes gene_type:complete
MKNNNREKLSPISYKKYILILYDIFSIVLSLSASSFLIYDNFYHTSQNYLINISIYILVFLLIFSLTGQYKSITRYVGSPDLYSIFLRCIFGEFFIYLILFVLKQETPSFKLFLIFIILLVSLLAGSRFIIRDFIYFINKKKNHKNNIKKGKEKIAIYGAGEAGVMLLNTLQNSSYYNVKYFLDDNSYKHNRFIKGIKVIHSDNIHKYTNKIDKIFLAIPSLRKSDKKNIIRKLFKYKIEVLEIPTLEEISTGKIKVDNLRKIAIEDILGREVIKIESKYIDSSLKDKTVLVTGAGGSIGYELCNQIIKANPSKVVLLDNNEPSLYLSNKKLKRNLNGKTINIIPILGDASDKKLIDNIFSKHNFTFVFHSAAYKHVPIVEQNPIQGLRNNIFSTYVMCDMAIKHDVEKLTLISSDKAVRPTNIMGASKRFSELIVQAFDYSINKNNKKSLKKCKTKLSMVRFGNVLDSSGSVVPLFREQISQGGPITLTHKDVIRYFMTIEEATQLVLQASLLSLGGELFLLDMGHPIKILVLAKQMIYLSGLTVKDKKNPNGDIEITTIGLRPGEKLYEELLIDAKSEPTIHPKIFKAKEKFIKPDVLWPKLKELKLLLDAQEKNQSLNLISKLIPDWNRQS